MEVHGYFQSGAEPKTDVPDIQIQFDPLYNMKGVGNRFDNIRPDVHTSTSPLLQFATEH